MNKDTLVQSETESPGKEYFETLVKQNMKRAYITALGFVGSHDAALDLSQEAFIRAYKNFRKFDRKKKFFTWYYKILKNLCLNYIRNRKKRKENHFIEIENENLYADNFSERIESDEILTLIEKAIEEWKKRDDIKVVLTIDREEEGWTEKVGFVAPIVKEVAPSANNAVAVVCGPPIMIKTTIAVLEELNFKDEQILNSLEMRMKCGVGKCGRCNIGNKYVCVDGPVFSLAELKKMPNEY